jgi:dynein light chain 1
MPPAGGGTITTQSLTSALKIYGESRKIEEIEEIKLNCQIPLIDKIDNSINSLKHIKILSLSTNSIEKIPPLSLPNLKRLSIGRNFIKKITGLEECGELEELWISYNQIPTLDGLNGNPKLRVLFISNNRIKEMNEIKKLNKNLENLSLIGNPIYDDNLEENKKIIKTSLNLKTLDGEFIPST